jgi:hypothetical protein
MVADDSNESLMAQMLTLSAGDLSVLEASLAKPDSTMMTVIGSANDRLWSKMERRGWLKKEVSLSNHQPLPFQTSAYRFADGGREAVAALFVTLLARARSSSAPANPRRSSEINQKMTAIANAKSDAFIKDLIDVVKQDGGDLGDVLTITSLTAAKVINAVIVPGKRRETFERFVSTTRNRIQE